MAGYECESCSGARPVTKLITDLITGSTDASCDEDLPITLVGQLALWLGVDPQRLYDAVQRFAAREAKSAAAQAAQQADPGGLDDSEACPNCGANSWGQTLDGRPECTQCQHVPAQPAEVTP